MTFEIDIDWTSDFDSIDTSDGREFLAEGRASDALDHYVIYVGGYDPYFDATEGGKPVWGEAFQASPGFNLEHYAFVYPESIAETLRTTPRASTNSFVNSVAATIVHEFSHLLGIGDLTEDGVRGAAGNPTVNNTSHDTSMTIVGDELFEGRVKIVTPAGDAKRGDQNPKTELKTSLRSQKSYVTSDNALDFVYTTPTGPAVTQLLTPQEYSLPEPKPLLIPVESALVGQVGSLDSNQIAQQFEAGFNQFESTLAADLVQRFNFGTAQIPFVESDLADVHDLVNELDALLTPLSLNGPISNFSELGSFLERCRL